MAVEMVDKWIDGPIEACASIKAQALWVILKITQDNMIIRFFFTNFWNLCKNTNI